MAVDLNPDGTAEAWWAQREDRHRRGYNTYNLFGNRVPVGGKKILDIGCGNGVIAAMYARAGARQVVGCDLGAVSLRDGRAYIASRGLVGQVIFTLGDATRLPFAAESFDMVVSDNACEHILGLEHMLAHCYRVLRPGGIVCLKFSPWWHPAGFHLMDYIPIPYAHLFFGERVLLEALLEMATEDPRIAASLPGLKRQPPPVSFVEMGMSPLNKVTVHQFRRMLGRTGFEVEYFHLQGFQRSVGHSAFKTALELATRVPGLNEFLTSHISCILRRPGGTGGSF
jgi:SAM-dependent methyltransferase